MSQQVPRPTLRELEVAWKAFEQHEPRALFYRAARELVDLRLQGVSSLTLAEAAAVLLQTWNRDYYRFHGPFDKQHFAALEAAINRHHATLLALRERGISTLRAGDEEIIWSEPLIANHERSQLAPSAVCAASNSAGGR